MQTELIKAEITCLETQYQNLEKLLDQSIRNNEVLAKTKKIYHELKMTGERLEKLKKINESDS